LGSGRGAVGKVNEESSGIAKAASQEVLGSCRQRVKRGLKARGVRIR